MKRYKAKSDVILGEPKPLFSTLDQNAPQNLEGFEVTKNPGTDKEEIVWLDKKTFEERYVCVDTFKDRIDVEIDELNVKITALTNALNEDRIPKDDLPLLRNQLHLMNSYSDTLVKRRNKYRDNG